MSSEHPESIQDPNQDPNRAELGPNQSSSPEEEFERLLKEVIRTGKTEDIQRLEELKQVLIQKKEELKEKLWPFPELSRAELESQYQTQIEILERTGLLVRLSKGELGIRIQDPSNPSAQEYPLPTFQEITQRLREKRDILKDKIGQGFNQIQITPLISIETLRQTLATLLIEHHHNHKLFKTKKDPNDPNEPLDLNTDDPVFLYEQFKDNPELRYYPKALEPDNHQGMTKDRLILETKGFNLILTEKDSFLPQENEEQISNQGQPNQRKRIQNNKTPIEYLTLQNQDPQYRNESYLTIEDWLTQFITHLEKTDQVSNDWQDHNATWLGGNYLPPTLEERQANPSSFGGLPCGLWRLDLRRAGVGWSDPGSRDSGWGVRPSVRI